MKLMNLPAGWPVAVEPGVSAHCRRDLVDRDDDHARSEHRVAACRVASWGDSRLGSPDRIDVANVTRVTDSSVDTLREFNRRRVLAAVRNLDTASRAELSRATGLSRNTVASIVAELQRDGFLWEGPGPGVRATGRGRPAALVRLAPPAGLAMAVDVGNEQIRVAVGDATGDVIEERSLELPPEVSAADMLAAAFDLVRDVTAAQHLAARELLGVTLGLPTPVDSVGRPVTARFKGFDLAACTGLTTLDSPILVRNDADLAALGEAFFGAARGIDDFIFVKVSHGLGAGLVLGGRLHRGSRGLAGDLGHVRVRDDGEVCRCGNRGCLETLTSARALVAALQPAHPGLALTFADLVNLVRAGDAGARVLVADAGRVIGRTLAELVTVLNPAAIVVGGSVGTLGEPLLAGVKESIARYGQPVAAADLPVVQSECGERASVLGGLALALGLSSAPKSAAAPEVAPADLRLIMPSA